MLGILTFHNAVNYGAILQTYALQRKLDDLGIENEVIDYHCPEITKNHRIRLSLINPVGYVIKKRTQKLFMDFLKSRVRMGEVVDEVSKIPQYDAYLVGSDQVWNGQLTGEDNTFFLRNVGRNTLKYSYAASMGNYRIIDADMLEERLNCIREFRGISVREHSLREYLQKCGIDGRTNKIYVHVDPVFLLSADLWEREIVHYRKKGFILLYMIKRDERLIEEAVKLGRDNGIPVLWASDSLRHYGHVKNKRCLDPGRFLGLFSDCSHVVTNSFHGTLLSLVFHKKFFTVTMKNGIKDERIDNLLNSMGIDVVQDNGIAKPAGAISWERIESIRKKLSDEAGEYLWSIEAEIRNNKATFC